ncbi:Fibrous sheath-interacting protein [Heracleum sosnowskyi]|uniref:Fibrous sheath-interacting protein n=1 Tax=Heracleum sosnowskyi TaxID=360622 RepID=A0AAD8ME73_9APIA|nr:Fibrous sheath-interacting protein [Heracleum sosnowskyi]
MRSSSNNPHAHFFSSIKKVEKRLKLENNTPISPSINLTSQTNSQSLSSPLYIHLDQPTSNTSTFQESEPPQEFLTKSLDFPETQKDPFQESIFKENPERFNLFETGGVDDIENLMQLLGFENDDQESVGLDLNSVCDDGFYGNVVKVKGPKCKKEVERLEGWIKYYMDCGAKNEPFVLAHLLLAKAAINSDGVEGFEFPSTVDEFLQNDPPQN